MFNKAAVANRAQRDDLARIERLSSRAVGQDLYNVVLHSGRGRHGDDLTIHKRAHSKVAYIADGLRGRYPGAEAFAGLKIPTIARSSPAAHLIYLTSEERLVGAECAQQCC